MQAPNSAAVVVTCPGCGTQNRIQPHAPTVSPLCGACTRSLAGVSPWSAKAREPVANPRGDLYGKLALASVVLVLGLITVVTVFQRPAGNGKPSLPTVASTTPKPPPQPLLNRRLGNGTMIKSGVLNGNGHLEVQNGLDRDAVVKLVPTMTKQCTAFFYVASKSTCKIEGIPDGQYNLLFCTGTDWDEHKKSFTRDKRFSRFQDPSGWNTTKETVGDRIRTRYTIHQITLHPIRGGKARSSTMGEGDFSQYE